MSRMVWQTNTLMVGELAKDSQTADVRPPAHHIGRLVARQLTATYWTPLLTSTRM